MPLWAVQLITTFAPSLISQLLTLLQAVVTHSDPSHPAVDPVNSAIAQATGAMTSLSAAATALKLPAPSIAS